MADNAPVSNGPLGELTPRSTDLGGGILLPHCKIDESALPTGATTEATLQKIVGFALPEFNYISAAYPSATQEVYTYKIGGSGGTTVATVTVNYTDSTKANISNLART